MDYLEKIYNELQSVNDELKSINNRLDRIESRLDTADETENKETIYHMKPTVSIIK